MAAAAAAAATTAETETAPLLPVQTGFLNEASSETSQREGRGDVVDGKFGAETKRTGQIRYRTLTDRQAGRRRWRTLPPSLDRARRALLRGLLSLSSLESSTVRSVGSVENCFGIPAVIDGRTRGRDTDRNVSERGETR